MALTEYRGYLTIVLLNLTALGLIVWQLRDARTGAVLIDPAPTRTPAPEPTEVRIRVYVSGSVASPDVVALREDARALDAIEAAGGFADAADRASVNLAQPLSDGQQLHVPATGEPPSMLLQVAAAAPLPDASARGGVGAGNEGAPAGGGSTASRSVNINRATAAELEALPGIGPALATRIVAHRQANGAFESPDDLLQVSGIGSKTLARFRDRVVVR